MIRLAVSGPGGTGKSTLTEILSAELDLPVVGEAVREWLAANSAEGPWSLSVEQQLELQEYAIAFKIDHERAAPGFVSDRTTIDAITLLTLRMERQRYAVPEDLRALAMRHASEAYDLAIILGPHRVSSELDTVALLDPTLRQREYDLTLSLYRLAGTPVILIATEQAGEIAPAARAVVAKWLAEKRRREIARELRAAAEESGLDAPSTALYLWGSLLGEEFRPEGSDVDALVLAATSPDTAAIDRMRVAAAGRHPALGRLDVTAISLRDLETGRSQLPLERIHADVFFARAHEWQHVWGRVDLLPPAPTPSIQRQLELRLQSLEERLRVHTSNPPERSLVFILKELGFIAHLVHQIEIGEHPFSYRALGTHATETTRPATDALLTARNDNWRIADPEGVERMARQLLGTLRSNGRGA